MGNLYSIEQSPSLSEVYSPVAYINGVKNGCHWSQIANTTVPIWSKSIFWPQPPDMQKPPMGRSLYIYHLLNHRPRSS